MKAYHHISLFFIQKKKKIMIDELKKEKLRQPPFKFYVITLTSKIINIYILH